MKKPLKHLQESWHWVTWKLSPFIHTQHEHGEGVAYLVADLYREAVSGHSHPRKKAVVDSFWNEEAEIDTF